MSRSRRFAPGIAVVAFAAFGFGSLGSPVRAQFGGQGAGTVPFPSGFPVVKLKEPASNCVYQRDANDRAEIPITLAENQKAGKIASAQVHGGGFVFQGKLVDCKLVGVPIGGPYTISCRFEGASVATAEVSNVFVGDLWVLAGQSNMEGVGDLIDVTPPHPRVMLLGMDGKWSPAEEPLHWLVDSPDPVHSGDPKTRAARSAQKHKTRRKGAGLGLPFAVGAGRVDRRSDRPGRLRPRRHQHGTVEPGQEGAGGEQPLRLDAAAGPARRRQGQGSALVSG